MFTTGCQMMIHITRLLKSLVDVIRKFTTARERIFQITWLLRSQEDVTRAQEEVYNRKKADVPYHMTFQVAEQVHKSARGRLQPNSSKCFISHDFRERKRKFTAVRKCTFYITRLSESQEDVYSQTRVDISFHMIFENARGSLQPYANECFISHNFPSRRTNYKSARGR